MKKSATTKTELALRGEILSMIRSKIASLGHTTGTLADELGMSRQYVDRFLSGTSNSPNSPNSPNLATLCRFFDILGITPHFADSQEYTPPEYPVVRNYKSLFFQKGITQMRLIRLLRDKYGISYRQSGVSYFLNKPHIIAPHLRKVLDEILHELDTGEPKSTELLHG